MSLPQARVDAVIGRLTDAHWPVVPDNTPGTDGIDPALVRGFVDRVCKPDYWHTTEQALNRLPHFTATIDGQLIHFVHFVSPEKLARPLLLMHGWPGSFLEFIEVAERLANPQAWGGTAQDAWSVVIPSLPGFGLSGAPPRPIGPRRIAALFDRLMVEVLGYAHYVAQGGDWGSVIASWQGFEQSACAAIHLNFHLGWAMPRVTSVTTAEREAAARTAQFMAREGAYISLQATKPLTLSYAMADSPLGAAAWILEKFNNWSDLRGQSLWSCFNPDRLCAIVLLYLLTDSFGTASWIYRGMLAPEEAVPTGARVAKPTGIACYPAEIGAYPRSMVEQIYDVIRWSEPSRGGHFAAFERPDDFVDDLTSFGRLLDQADRPKSQEHAE